MNLINKLDEKPIIFVGGKGGVGKTTIAAALATRFAEKGQKTLIISTDPAHSLGDAFQQKLGHQKTTVCTNLDAIELNPDVIIHKHYQQVERTLSGYTLPEMMPKVREFLRLSQHAPGAEEAAMLEAICQHLVDAQQAGYAHIVFDTAPTGHTLRLLSLPEMMNAWTEGLLAQQKRQTALRSATVALDKKKTIAALSNQAEERWQSAVTVLKKRQQLFKTAATLLHDAKNTAIVLVMIAESLAFLETQRALLQLQEAKLPCQGLVINQMIDTQQPNAFWQARAQRQQRLLGKIAAEFATLPQLKIPLYVEDIRGVTALAKLWASID